MVRPDAEPEKERRQKTPADVAFVFRGHSAQKPNRLHRGAKQYPAGWKDSGGVYGRDEPYADPRLSPRASPTRQAGFTAARTAANSLLWRLRSCGAITANFSSQTFLRSVLLVLYL